jgi:hypothetical protein
MCVPKYILFGVVICAQVKNALFLDLFSNNDNKKVEDVLDGIYILIS